MEYHDSSDLLNLQKRNRLVLWGRTCLKSIMSIKNIRINTTILKSSFWNYGERYITTECKITGTTAYTIAFKNTALGAALGDAADFLDVVMPIYNFIE